MIDLTNVASRNGALKALQVILTSKQRTIEVTEEDIKANEQKKNPLTMPKNIKINKTEEQPSDNQTPEEKASEEQARIEKVKQDLENPEQTLDDIKMDVQQIDTEKAMKAKKAREREEREFAGQYGMESFGDFESDLFSMIKNEVKLSDPEDSYKRVNPTYAGTDLLMPGKRREEKKEKIKVQIYFDQSGSWGSSDIEKGEKALMSIEEFERRGKVVIEEYYFANHLHTTPKGQDWDEGGTHGFNEVLANIDRSNPDNVIIMSDDDIERQTYWAYCPKVEIKGTVIWLWRNGSNSPKAMRYLRGRKDNVKYLMR